MTSTTFFFVFIPLLAIILLAVNLIFAPHNPYQEKDSAFECGFHSFLGQNRTQFSISFFIFALLFLLFDLEILLVYPYVVSAYVNGIYGLVIMLIFFLALTLGFAFELGKNALKIDSRQMFTLNNQNTKSVFSVLSTFKNNIIFTSCFIWKRSNLNIGVWRGRSYLSKKVKCDNLVNKTKENVNEKGENFKKVYLNANTSKAIIFSENKGKTGIYRLINNINGKSYIGSAANVRDRFTNYYNIII